MNWRDGHASAWGDAIRGGSIDHLAEIAAWRAQIARHEASIRLREAGIIFDREGIAHAEKQITALLRAQARAALANVDYMAVPRAN